MAAIPSILTDFNAFFQNNSFAGRCNTIKLPKISVKTADFSLAGIGGDIERSIGKLEKLECEVTISDYAPKINELLGSPSSRDEVFTIRGALDVGHEVHAVVIRQQGFWKSAEFNEWKESGEATMQFSIAVEMFEMIINGTEIIHIDKLNNVFRVNGTDRNAAIRNALAQ